MSDSNPSSFGGWFASPPPPAAVEISARRVSVVAMSTRTITAQSSEDLPAGVVTPVMNGVNVHDPAALAGAIRSAVERISPKPRRVALILPDSVAKVSLLRFEKVPARTPDLEKLVRWQMRKAVPFRIEEAQVSWVEGVELEGGGREYLVLVARRELVESYEAACEAAGVQAGIVDIASINLVNAVLATNPGASAGDWLLVYVVPEFATMMIVRQGRVIFYRNRPSDGAPSDMGDLVHQTAMYFEDRLRGSVFSRVVLAGGSASGGDAEGLRRQIEERLGVRVEPLDVRGAVTWRDRIGVSPDLLDVIAPAVGVLLRDRPAAGGGERVA
ncbi:MAG: pilus assembly protein PilM [Acidobacteria bacterium]|nr:pilus assembly protein PilM [Acidobacteriota bacterium]